MKYLNIVLSVLMILFAGVQYNDPDGLLWAVIYLIPAIWAGLVAFRPAFVRGTWPLALLGACVAAGLAGVLYYWPKTPEFWRREVWWETETAREGMGMMFAAAVLIVAFLSAWRAGSKHRAAA
jgi:hypothetical protein